MGHRLSAAFRAWAFGLAALTACGGGGPPEVAATVGGASVASAELERLTDQWLGSEARLQNDIEVKSSLDRTQAARFALVYLIRLAALEQVASELGVVVDGQGSNVGLAATSTPEEALAATGWSRTDFVQTHRAAELSRAVAEEVFPEISVSEAELRRDYERHSEAFGPSWEARVAIAFFDTDPPARRLATEALGTAGFEATARRLGAREATTLERVTPLTPLPPPVLEVVGALPPEQVSGPIAGGGGVVVVAVESRLEVAARSFEAAREELRNRRIDQERQRRFFDWFDRRLSAMPVKVSGHYGRWDPELRLVT